jgi:hypothetical protein
MPARQMSAVEQENRRDGVSPLAQALLYGGCLHERDQPQKLAFQSGSKSSQSELMLPSLSLWLESKH